MLALIFSILLIKCVMKSLGRSARIIISILVMWLECQFLDTEVNGLNPALVCCVLEQDTLSALLQSTQL